MEISNVTTFDSAHFLKNPRWDEVKNKNVYGKCYNLHGHTYKLTVTVSGEPEEDGMVINFTLLKALIKSEVIDLFDHRLLNECPDFQNIIPTAENISKVIWGRLEKKITEENPKVILSGILLYETPNSYVEIKRNEA